MALDYRIIKDPDRFAKLSSDWNELLGRSTFPNPFLTWEWQFSCWQAFGGDLFLILVEEQGTLLALFPFISKQRLFFVELVPLADPYSDYLSPLIQAGEEERVLDGLLSTFLPTQPQVGLLTFAEINERFPFKLFQKERAGAWRSVQTKNSVCPYLPLPTTFKICLDSLSPQSRYAIRRKERTLQRECQVTWGVVVEPKELESRLSSFMAQHQARWHGRNRPGAFHTRNIIDFHQTVSKRFLQTDSLRLYYLDIDGQPASSYYLFKQGKTLFFYLSGFNPELARFSPSSVLLARIIQTAIEQNMAEFDFMRGTAHFKFNWTKQTRTNYSYQWQRLHPTVRVHLHMARRLKRMAIWIKQGLSTETKHWIRDRLPKKWVTLLDPFFR
ncbi:MAG: GNAT family N-acetyltransferase [Magnetococcales bacterium]|nr:GNAT family N-acetyltransferase [Magnetococcales bacterium]